MIGTCSMIPAVHLIKHLGEKHPDMTISSEQKSLDELMEGLQNNTYQYIIFPHKPENAEHLHVEKLMEEHLYFNLPKTHSLADRTELSLSDINGENMIVMPNTGFWEKVIAEKMPDSRFLVQTNKDAFEDLLAASILPSFTTNQAMKEYRQPSDRIPVLINDPEVNISFYVISKKNN